MTEDSQGKRLKQIRKDLKLSQDEFASRVRRDRSTISKIESGDQELTPAMRHAICAEFSINEEWLVTGGGEKYLFTEEWLCTGDGEKIRVNVNNSRSRPMKSHAVPPHHPAAAMIPVPVETQPGIDPCIQAMADIKEIFDSGDPILIPAIQANLHAFKRALQRERQFEQILQENEELKNRITKLEKLYPELKNHLDTLKAENLTLTTENNRLKSTYEAPHGDDGNVTGEKKAM